MHPFKYNLKNPFNSKNLPEPVPDDPASNIEKFAVILGLAGLEKSRVNSSFIGVT